VLRLQFYYLFGFLFLVFIILIITCAEITIVLCYFQLCSEDYHWWCAEFACLHCTALLTLTPLMAETTVRAGCLTTVRALQVEGVLHQRLVGRVPVPI